MKIRNFYDNNKSLLSSIIFLILGVVLLNNPEAVLTFVSVGIGTVILCIGIYKIFIYNKVAKALPTSKLSLFTAVCYLVFGLVFIFFAGLVESMIRFVFGAWILFSGISQFISTISMSVKNTKFISKLIVSILLIILSLYVIFTNNLILSGIGIVMIVYSTIEIVGFIFDKKNVKEVVLEEGDTTLIVPDKKKK